MSIRSVLPAALTLSLSLIVGTAAAATITVSPTGAYQTLSAAVAAAASGDTIVITPGTYSTYLQDTKGKDLTIESSDSAATTILVGNGKQPVVTVKSGTVSFRGLTFTNPYVSPTATGGRAFLASGGNITVSESVFASNGTSALNGGAMNVSAATVNLVNNSFDSNNGKIGAHILMASNATVNASGTTFSNGTASDRGGAISVAASTLNLSNCDFTSNTAVYWGGAMRVTQASTVTITGGSFTGNESTTEQGGAISSAGNSALSVDSANFSSNTSVNGGGAIYFEEGPFVLDASTFSGNSTSVGAGGAILILERLLPTDYGLTTVTIADSSFDANLSPTNGGAIAVNDVGAAITLSSFTNNEADTGGAVYVADLEGNGGGITLSENVFDTNSASDIGGGLSLTSPNGILVLQNTFVANNASTSGAAASIECNYSAVFGSNVVAHHTGGADVLTSGASCDLMEVAFNGFHDSVGGFASGLVNSGDLAADGNILADPDFVGYTGNPGTNSLQLNGTSPLLEAASPWFLGSLGTRFDVGAWP